MKKRIKAKNAPPLKTRRTRRYVLFLCVLCVLCGGGLPHAQDKGTILFVGSSIFHRWTQLTSQMAPLPVTNIAFDGAVTEDWNRLIDVRVIPLKPRVVVYYCGSNDVDAGDSASRIVARVRIFIDRVTNALPDT